MKYVQQFGIICLLTFIGELLYALLPLPVPAGIYGLVLLFAALCLKIIKLEQVEAAADFMLSAMPVMFVPPTVNLMTRWDILRDNLFGLLVTCILSTIIVMVITGQVAQAIMRTRHKKEKGRPSNE